MPRYSCPGHPDCSIDCPAGGGAFFHEPYGPCDVFCEDGAFGASILRLGPGAILDIRLSGMVRHYPMRGIGTFARALSERDLDVGAGEIATLIELSVDQPEARIDASWRNAGLLTLLNVLIEASPLGGLRPA